VVKYSTIDYSTVEKRRRRRRRRSDGV